MPTSRVVVLPLVQQIHQFSLSQIELLLEQLLSLPVIDQDTVLQLELTISVFLHILMSQ